MQTKKEAGALGKRPACKSHSQIHPTAAANNLQLTRRNFLNRFIGRALTVGVFAAEAAKKDSIVNRLLQIKDRLNRRRAQ